MPIQDVFDDCGEGCPDLVRINLQTGVVTFTGFNGPAIASPSVSQFGSIFGVTPKPATGRRIGPVATAPPKPRTR